jgi:tetratricopeptide (TPR) repeat protein
MNVARKTLLGVALAIFALAFWLHWPSVHGGFLNGDDKDYLERAEHFNGLTWEAVKWAFTTKDPYYQPLPRLSHALDYQLWGKNAVGHHATCVFLHALNAIIVFGFMWTLLGALSMTNGERLTVAAVIAVVFAIHPLQVESVAWISGRTQMHCALFGFSCLWAYAANMRWWVVWGLFVLALLCKPMAVSLPFVMVAMDYFPLRRYDRLDWRQLLREKAVLIVLAVVVSVATITTESSVGETLPLAPRLWMVFPNVMFYVWRLVFPVHFAPFYSLRVGPSPFQWRVVVSILSVGMITALAVWGWRRVPALAAAWSAYLAIVLPVTGLVHGGWAAPRHAYLAMLPLLPLAGGAALWLWRRSRTVVHYVVIGLFATELCVFGFLTRSLIPDWRNDETVFRAVLVWFPDTEFANRTLAITLLDQKRGEEALVYAKHDVQIAPQLGWSHVALGAVLKGLGRFPEAAEQYEMALQLKADTSDVHQDLGNVLLLMDRLPEAIEQYEQALQLKPNVAETHYNLGLCLEKTGKLQEAIEHWEQAVQLKPDNVDAHYNLGLALARLSRIQEAAEHWAQALRLKPDNADARYNLGLALVQMGRFPEAARLWEDVVRLKPDDGVAHYNLGLCLEKMGHTPEAIEHYQEALKFRPDLATAKSALIRLGDGQ